MSCQEVPGGGWNAQQACSKGPSRQRIRQLVAGRQGRQGREQRRVAGRQPSAPHVLHLGARVEAPHSAHVRVACSRVKGKGECSCPEACPWDVWRLQAPARVQQHCRAMLAPRA